jgi:hypothetical protein
MAVMFAGSKMDDIMLGDKQYEDWFSKIRNDEKSLHKKVKWN